jgi:hypothetical protein
MSALVASKCGLGFLVCLIWTVLVEELDWYTNEALLYQALSPM